MPRFRRKRNVGHHSAIIDGIRRDVKPGEVVVCKPEELGGFISDYEALDPPAPEAEPKVKLIPVHVSKGRWNVLHGATGEPVNADWLNAEEAEAMAKRPIAEVEAEVAAREKATDETEPNVEDLRTITPADIATVREVGQTKAEDGSTGTASPTTVTEG